MKRLFLAITTAMTLTTGVASARSNPIIDYFTPGSEPQGKVTGIPFKSIQLSDYKEALEEGMRRQNAEIKAIVDNPETPTFQNTIAALDRSGALLMGADLVLGNVEHATGQPELMRIVTEITPALSAHNTAIMLNQPLFERVKYVYDHRSGIPGLTGEQMMLIEDTYKGFVSSGANLTGAARERYARLNAELSDLRVRYAQNVTNEMKSPDRRLWLTEAETAGIPESAKRAARAEAAEVLAAEGKTDDGSLYLFTVFYPSYSPLMKYASDRSVRERMYRLYNSRNISGQYSNVEILKDIANIRLEIANLLGYPDYASLALDNKMAKNSENVYGLLNQLCEAYKPAMLRELDEIQKFARQTEGADFVLMPWDYSYWADKLKNDRYAFNDEDMKPYFELNNTIKGVFGLATKLYGYKFTENKSLDVYHPDVKAYNVTDDKGAFLGVLYADFYYRPGKAPGAWMTEYRPEMKDDAGNRRYPLISIVCNFSKPTGNEPVLLTPYEVETFLHEFGHALHGLSANSTYSSLSGTNVRHDFVELFSQFNENYLPQKEFLDMFARHYKTGKKMPKDLLDKFIRSSQFGAGYACMRQLGFGELDMAYHTFREPMRASASLPEFELKATEKVQTFAPVEGCLTSPCFAHIFSGGYAAGYYGYKWAEVLDADAFAAFLETGNIFDKATAGRFRTMLQSGGSVEPAELYRTFRGKDPSVDALMCRDGIRK